VETLNSEESLHLNRKRFAKLRFWPARPSKISSLEISNGRLYTPLAPTGLRELATTSTVSVPSESVVQLKRVFTC